MSQKFFVILTYLEYRAVKNDPVGKLDFCRPLFNTDVEDALILCNILWTDESKVSNEGITNPHRENYWELEDNGTNPSYEKIKRFPTTTLSKSLERYN